ncbi:hypothetical protein J6X90_02220, partial [Candidatus Saccharibacteria bacterium]|nr:hypothetical protein [Candidatus Saccharibacteria bacterium]
KALPSFGTAADGTVVNQMYFEGGTPQAVTSTEWNGFMTNYLMQPFEDPNGTPYNISITSCSSVDGAGSSCEDTNYFQTKSTKKAIKDFFKTQFPNDYTVLIVVNGKCFSSEKVIYTPGNRTVAVLYKLESGGTFCENN